MAKKKQAELEDEVIYEDVENLEEEGSEAPFGDFVEKNQKLVMGIGIGLLLIVGGFFGYNWYQDQQNVEANRDMFQAVYYFEADSFNQALNGDGQYPGFLAITEDYPGTSAAEMANYYIGLIYLNSGNPQVAEAINYLEKVPASNTMMGMSRNVALAFAYEEQGDAQKAAELFEDAAYIPAANDQTTPTMLMNAGRNYEQANQPDKALRLYQTIKEEYPLSTEGLRIDKFIGRVSQ